MYIVRVPPGACLFKFPSAAAAADNLRTMQEDQLNICVWCGCAALWVAVCVYIATRPEEEPKDKAE